jgi:D-glycero-alpha-D-manno-heptose 1-phosphate guanylyltransferase
LREAIILAGGKGTRLQHLLQGMPKCLAPVRGIPFLNYIIEYLVNQQTTHIIISLGHLHELIEKHLNLHYPHLHTTIVVEEHALGTGGAILKSMEKVKGNDVFILNGDTYFPVSLNNMEILYNEKQADLVLATTMLEKPYRFGTISYDENFRIQSFHEKKDVEAGYINGGCYLISKQSFLDAAPSGVFSFEKDMLEKKVTQWEMYASLEDVFFTDIGIPEDYMNAQDLLPEINNNR